MKNLNNLNAIIIIVVSSFFLFQSCRNTVYEFKYFENGNIHLKYEVVNNMRNRECIEYYEENGGISSITTWKDDTLNGSALYYYESGELQESCKWINGVLLGPYQKYFENNRLEVTGNYYFGKQNGVAKFFTIDGKLETIRKYLILGDGESFINEVIVFEQDGDTNYNKSNFFEVKINNDSVNLGDYFKAQVILRSPYFLKSEMFVFFDIPHDTTSYRRIYSDNFSVSYDYLPNNTGLHKFSGVIEEFSITEDAITKGKSRYMYFDYDYYVK